MNPQEPNLQSLLDSVATPDKPSAPVTPKVNSLEESFIINEAGESPLLPTEESTTTENPLLTDDPKAQSRNQTKLDLAALSCIQLPKYANWDYDNVTPSILFKGNSFLLTLMFFVIALALGVIFAFIMVWAEVYNMYMLPVLSFLMSFIYLLSFPIVKRNYKLRITIHDNEIILQENMGKNSPCYVFPRDSSCSVVREKRSFYTLYNISLYSKDNFYYSTCALLNTESECIINLINDIISASVKIPVHPETPANPSKGYSLPDSLNKLISRQSKNQNSDGDFFL